MNEVGIRSTREVPDIELGTDGGGSIVARLKGRELGGRIPSPLGVVAWFVIVGLPLYVYGDLILGSHLGSARVLNVAIEALALVGLYRLVRPGSFTFAAVNMRSFELWAVAGLCLAGSVAGYRGLLLSGGVPVLRHDWAWPVDPTDMRLLFAFVSSDWVPNAFGGPKPYPTLYPIFALLSPLGAVFSPQTILIGLLFACELVMGLGAYVAVRSLVAARPWPALVAAAFYAFSPYVVDKAVAGHLHVIIAYAIFPWLVAVLRAFERSPQNRLPAWVALEAGLVGVSMSALTFVAFEAIALLLVGLALERRRRVLGCVALALAGGALCHAQSLYHLFRSVAAGADFGPTALDWLTALSTDPVHVLSLFGYFTPYAASAFPAAFPLALRLLVVPVAHGLLCWSVLGRARTSIAFGVLGFLGIVATTGTQGPLGGAKYFVYGHVHALAAFREFYNIEELVLLALAFALAALLGTLKSSLRSALVAALVGTSIAIAVFPFLSGTVGRELLLWREPGAYAAFAQQLPERTGERIAMFPLVPPIRLGAAPFAGTDMYSRGFHGHPTLAEWSPEPSISLAAVLFRKGDVRAGQRLLGLLGVKWLLLRKGYYSALPDYWFRELFPSDWQSNAFYGRIEASPDFVRRDDNSDFALLEDPAATPIVSLAPAPRACADFALLALSRGACTTPLPRSASVDPRTVQPVALAPQSRSINPEKAWTSPHAIFALGEAFAAASGGVATVGSNRYSVQFVASQGARLFVRCLSRTGTYAYLDGTELGARLCRGPVDAQPAWWGPFAVREGTNHLDFVGGPGPNMIDDVVVSYAVANPSAFGAFRLALPFDAAYQRAHLQAVRESATALAGGYDSASPATLLFSDDFDSGWALQLDDNASIRSQRVNGIENGFAVPPGRHSFRLAFATSVVDRFLGALELAMWPFFALVACLALFALPSAGSSAR